MYWNTPVNFQPRKISGIYFICFHYPSEIFCSLFKISVVSKKFGKSCKFIIVLITSIYSFRSICNPFINTEHDLNKSNLLQSQPPAWLFFFCLQSNKISLGVYILYFLLEILCFTIFNKVDYTIYSIIFALLTIFLRRALVSYPFSYMTFTERWVTWRWEPKLNF